MDEAHVQGEGVDSVDQVTKCSVTQESKDVTLKYVIIFTFEIQVPLSVLLVYFKTYIFYHRVLQV